MENVDSFPHRLLLIAAIAILGFSIAGSIVSAAPTDQEKVQDAADQGIKGAKKTMRGVSDALCAKNDVHCLSQKAKHKVQNGADDVGTKAKELKEKSE